jgi:predicted alpha/beta hydrolase family esterase
LDWERPVRADWVSNIEKAVSEGSNVILVGHSLACCAIAYWSQTTQARIRGALLVAPSDTEAPSYPPGTIGFTPMPLFKLPFPSITVTSTNDIYVTPERAKLFASAWNSELIFVDNAGHINVAAGFGAWPEGLELLRKLDHLP